MYKTKKSLFGKIVGCVTAIAMLTSMSAMSAFAATPTETGEYSVDSSLSMYVNAMGGIEFAKDYGLLKETTVEVKEDGDAYVTLELGVTSGLQIYTVDCTAFIGTEETPGYYKDGSVTKENVTYTVSDETVATSSGQANYITSITMPIDTSVSEHYLWLYLNSNVMGCQFGDGSGSGASNNPGVATPYKAILTVDWDSAEKIVQPDESSNQTATVEYVVNAGYEVEIPATITVDPHSKTGAYEVTAQNFVIGDNAYVKVVASESGKLTSGANELAFTNTLAEGQLQSTGDSLTGTVAVTGSPSVAGTYTGTIDFTINYYSGE